MATGNPFDLLGDDENEDPSLLVAAAQKLKSEPSKKSPAPAPAPTAKLPSKPLPPAQSVREAKSESLRGGRGGGRGFGRGGRGGGFNRDPPNNDRSYDNKELSADFVAPEGSDTGKLSERRGGYGGSFRGGRRGGFGNGESGEGERVRNRRPFDRHSQTGRGNGIKREGAGRGNWGTQTDESSPVTEEVVNEGENTSGEVEEAAADKDKEIATNEGEEKEPEDKEMTLEEYEKVLEEKRKALQALKTEERKVDNKEFQSMKQIANKKNNDEIFAKLGSDKDKKKELAEKEERAKKSVSINEFLKPSDGDRRYSSGGRGRGRGRGPGGGYTDTSNAKAPSIEDHGQFPTLGGK